MRRPARLGAAALLATALVTAPAGPAGLALALDHGNLDEGRPVRLEDPYAIASGEIALEAGPAFLARRGEGDLGAMAIAVQYGLLPNLQAELGSTFLSDPGAEAGEGRSGDVRLGALYNLNQETRLVPALGFRAGMTYPSGPGSRGLDVRLKTMVAKSAGRLGVHLNAAWERLDGTARGERDTRREAAIGVAWPAGAPRHTRTLLVGDLFVEQSAARGARRVTGVEAGFRHQLARRLVIDGAVGRELRGPDDRLSLFASTGVSLSF
ncbi:MAG TPA: hypothetical protein VJV23_03565 [Candidatus Polarisedimenticolia bacterium]|nr:hypothetical protein [Candidatus Polarisedimenticolia bacterium]